MITVWLLLWTGMHSYPSVSGIATKDECERLFQSIKGLHWANGSFGDDHVCLPYKVTYHFTDDKMDDK